MSKKTITKRRSIRVLLMALGREMRRFFEFRIPSLDTYEAGNRQEINGLVRSQGVSARDMMY